MGRRRAVSGSTTPVRWGHIWPLGILLGLSCTGVNPTFDEPSASSDGLADGESSATPADDASTHDGATDDGQGTTGVNDDSGGQTSSETDTGDDVSDSGGVLPPWPTAPFDPPQPVSALNTNEADDDPTLTADMLEIIFASTRFGGPGGQDLWTSVRDSVDAPWPPPVPVEGLNTDVEENTPDITSDGLTLLFTSTRGGQGGYDVFMATRPTRNDPWSDPQPVVEINSSADEYGSVLTGDLLRLYICSTRSGDQDLWVTSRETPDTAWNTPILLDDVSTNDQDCVPWIDPSDNVLLLATNRPGGQGDHDLWQVRRSQPGGTFDEFTNLATINSSALEDDPWQSPDGKTIYFCSGRNGSRDLFVATRP